jgi:DNA-binding Lrp family transcriptional regulator
VVEDKWYSRALPIMEVVNEYEDEGRDIVAVAEIAETTNLQAQAVLTELKRLVGEGFIGESVRESFGGVPGAADLYSPSLREKGARAVNAWPPDDAYDALVTVLDRRLAEETDEDRRGKLQKTRDVVLDVGKGVLTGVLADLARRPFYRR